MSHCYHHSLSSAKIFGGSWEDYYKIHNWFDQSKAAAADFRHRAILHHSAGIFMLEKEFGPVVTTKCGILVPTRLIGEQHVKEDCGFIPTISDWIRSINPEAWMRKGYPLDTEISVHSLRTETITMVGNVNGTR